MYFFVILESLRFVFEFTDSAQFILTELHSFPDLWLNLPQVIGWTVLPFQTKWNRDDRFDWGGGKLTFLMIFKRLYKCPEILLWYNEGFYLKLGNVIKFVKCYVRVKYDIHFLSKKFAETCLNT